MNMDIVSAVITRESHWSRLCCVNTSQVKHSPVDDLTLGPLPFTAVVYISTERRLQTLSTLLRTNAKSRLMFVNEPAPSSLRSVPARRASLISTLKLNELH